MAELIDRETVRLAYEKSLENDKHKIAGASAIHTQEHRHILHILDKIPAVDPESLKPQWVSVYDKLPSAGERVLATDGAFVGEMYINKRGQWTRYNDKNSNLMMALDILWWLPMPQPPETKGAGEDA